MFKRFVLKQRNSLIFYVFPYFENHPRQLFNLLYLLEMSLIQLFFGLSLIVFSSSYVLRPLNVVSISKWASTQLKMAAAPPEFNWKQTKKACEDKMNKCLDSVQQQFNTVRAGAANPAILDRVFIDYYGTSTPLNQVARISTSGAQMLIIDPFEKQLLKDIEKAIAVADLNLTPTADGQIIRISIPPLTEERRKELTKQAKTITEDGKVAVRNVRREYVDKIKVAEKDKTISKDDSKDFQDDLQKVVDGIIKKLDDMYKNKEKDLMKV
jgi:ribosome recycling factor